MIYVFRRQLDGNWFNPLFAAFMLFVPRMPVVANKSHIDLGRKFFGER